MKNVHHSSFEVARVILIIWCLFIGIGAVGGATAMLIKPDGSLLGMDTLLPYFQVLPFAEILFQDYIFPGIALLCVNGITNLVAAALLFAKKKSGVVCGTVFGITLMAWIVIQFVIFPANFLSTIYFIFGFLQALTGFSVLIYYQHEHFFVDTNNYKNVGTSAEHLVVYFSRMGYTKKLAYECANSTGAQTYEVKSTELVQGTLGFWWCGRYGMHKWGMPIENVDIDLSKFKSVTICTPVWVFNLAPPIRSFCKIAKGKISEAHYVINHFNFGKYSNVAREMDNLLGIKALSVKSVCTKWGKVRIEYKLVD